MTLDQCGKVNDGGRAEQSVRLRSEAPVNVGDNYNRPKVTRLSNEGRVRTGTIIDMCSYTKIKSCLIVQ